MHIRDFFNAIEPVLDHRLRQNTHDPFRLTRTRQVLRAEYHQCHLEIEFNGKASVTRSDEHMIEQVKAPLEITSGPTIHQTGGEFTLAESLVHRAMLDDVIAIAAEVVSRAEKHRLYTDFFRTVDEYGEFATYDKALEAIQ